MLEVLGNRCNLRHGCKAPFSEWLSLVRPKPTYTLSLFTQPNLRHLGAWAGHRPCFPPVVTLFLLWAPDPPAAVFRAFDDNFSAQPPTSRHLPNYGQQGCGEKRICGARISGL